MVSNEMSFFMGSLYFVPGQVVLDDLDLKGAAVRVAPKGLS
jgi:hypothetical protein